MYCSLKPEHIIQTICQLYVRVQERFPGSGLSKVAAELRQIGDEGLSRSECFFFFQAEDGIRDVAVTGVQTCALPISRPARRSRWWAPVRLGSLAPSSSRAPGTTSRCSKKTTGSAVFCATEYPISRWRSEKRRVGEEGRSRGAPYH